MKKSQLLLLLFLLSLNQLNAQFFQDVYTTGGKYDDYPSSTVIDGKGNIITMGVFSGEVDFDPGPNTYYLSPFLSSGSYVQKLDKNGKLLWAIQSKGAYPLHVTKMITDAEDNIYLTGDFIGQFDFDFSDSLFVLSEDTGKAFVLKLNSSGNFMWAKNFAGYNGRSSSIAVDADQNVYTCGSFYSTSDFDPNGGVYNMTSYPSVAGFYVSIFISKFNKNGDFEWAKSIGNSGSNSVYSIGVDENSNVYTSGYFQGTFDFDPSVNVFNMTTYNSTSFILKLNNGGDFIWAKQFSSSTAISECWQLEINNKNEIYTMGTYAGEVDFDPGPGSFLMSTLNNYRNLYLTKLDSSGNFIWVKNFSNSTNTWARKACIALDSLSNIYTSGSFNKQMDGDPGSGTQMITATGLKDIFISKLDRMGDFIWIAQLNGSDLNNTYESVASIFPGKDSDVFVTGSFSDTVDFDPQLSVHYKATSGLSDAFILKLKDSGTSVYDDNPAGGISFVLFPNPSKDKLTIVADLVPENAIVKITNSLGQVMDKVNYGSNLNVIIDISKYSAGVYFVDINFSKIHKRFKFIKA